MRVNLSTRLNCPPARAWQEAQTSRLLFYVTTPLATYKPLQPAEFPERWAAGKYLVEIKIAGVIPFSKHWIVITMLEIDTSRQTYQLRDNGYGDMISKWDHLITIAETADGMTAYTDNVDIEAGLLTLSVWIYAQVFYRYRQLRWRKLVSVNFAYSTG